MRCVLGMTQPGVSEAVCAPRAQLVDSGLQQALPQLLRGRATALRGTRYHRCGRKPHRGSFPGDRCPQWASSSPERRRPPRVIGSHVLMPRFTVEPLPPGCPWSGYTPPNVDWCEEELCGWIVNPADTWSNLAYVLFGAVMWVQARRVSDAEGGAALRLFGPASVVVGACSFAYHASYTYLLQLFDFAGMFLFCFTLITANAQRIGWVAGPQAWRLLAAGTVLLTAAVPLVSETVVPIQSMVGVLILAILGQEAFLARGASPDRATGVRRDYRLFFAALALLAGAAVASLADVTRTFCDPGNHFVQGHALWHVLSAASLYAMFRFYAPPGLSSRAGAPGAGSVPASR